MAAKTEKPKSLQEKLIEIATEVPYIQKKGTNEALDYKYVGDAQVVETLRSKFLERGITVIPRHRVVSVNVIDRGSKAANIVTTIESEFVFQSGDDAMLITTVGQGADTGDKGIFKAMTGARKYAFLQALMIATGDDPEETRADEMETVGKITPSNAATPAQKQKLHVMGKAVNLSDEDLRKLVFKETGKNQSADLTKDDMNKMFEVLKVMEATGAVVE